MGATEPKEAVHFTVRVNGKEVERGKVDKENADVMQTFDLKAHTTTGAHKVEIEATGETNLMYQIVGRHFAPWQEQRAQEKRVLDVDVAYDRTKLTTNDLLKVKATLKYHGKVPTSMVMLDLPIAPGFTVDPGDFAEMVGKKQIQRFDLTARTATLYLGDVRPGDALTFEYALRPKYPLRARTPAAVAWEYYTPSHRAEARPVELTVEDRK
jgi:hypothetical protein